MSNPNTFSFSLGSAEVLTNHLNELREVVEEMKAITNCNGMEVSNNLADFIFSVEKAYQEWYDLDEDNWDMIHQ